MRSPRSKECQRAKQTLKGNLAKRAAKMKLMKTTIQTKSKIMKSANLRTASTSQPKTLNTPGVLDECLLNFKLKI